MRETFQGNAANSDEERFRIINDLTVADAFYLGVRSNLSGGYSTYAPSGKYFHDHPYPKKIFGYKIRYNESTGEGAKISDIQTLKDFKELIYLNGKNYRELDEMLSNIGK